MKAILDLPTAVYSGKDIHKNIGELLEAGSRILIVTDEGLAATPVLGMITSVLEKESFSYSLYTDISPNPDEETVLKIVDYIRENKIESIIALGGGSPLDAAKAAAALAPNERPMEDYQWNGRIFEKSPLPLIAVPTTAGTGSEVTGVAVISSRNLKKGIKQDAIFPKAALIDPALMTGLPPFLTAVTGLDALTHAVEAYTGLGSNPLTDSLCLEAIKLITENLPIAFGDGTNLEARDAMALASTMAGIAMDQAGLGIVHSLASPVCSYLHLSHGFANALLLTYGMEFNLEVSAPKYAKIAELLGVDVAGLDEKAAGTKAIEKIRDLVESLDLTDRINEVRAQKIDTKEYGDNASRMFLIHNNPRKAGAEECAKIFEGIFA